MLRLALVLLVAFPGVGCYVQERRGPRYVESPHHEREERREERHEEHREEHRERHEDR